jgi:hypothetical protein
MIISTEKWMGIQSKIMVVPLDLLLLMYIEFDCIFSVNDNESVILIRNDNSPL